MKKLSCLLALLLTVPAMAQRGGAVRPASNRADSCVSTVQQDVACPGYEHTWCVDYSVNVIFACSPTTHHWEAVGSGGGGGGAPINATYITKTANSTLNGEFALGSLGTGILKNTTTTGNLSIAVAGDFPTLNQSTTGNAATASAFDHDPLACLAGRAVNDISTTGALGCIQLAFSDLSGEASELQIPSAIARDGEVSVGYQPLDTDLTQLSALDSCTDGKIPKVSGGVWSCQDDSTTTSGTGITTLNTLTANPQSFAATNDSNVTLGITSATSTHTFALGWSGRLPYTRQPQLTNGLAVLGVAGNATADVAGIAAASDGQVLRRSGTSVGFGTLDFSVTPVTTGSFPYVAVATGGAGLIDTQVADTLTIGSGSTITLPNSAAPTPTVEGRIEWENDVDHIVVGDGTTQTVFVPTNDVSGDITMTTAGATAIGNNKVNGAMLALGSDATGDTMYYNGTDYVRLPATTNGFVLTLTGGVPAWATPPGGVGTVGIQGSPSGTQMTGWFNGTTVQGIGGTAFDSSGNLTATSFNTPANATLGGTMTLLEGDDDAPTVGNNQYFQIKVPDSGLTATKICTLTAAGLLPAGCVAAVAPSAMDTTNSATTGYVLTKAAGDQFTWAVGGSGTGLGTDTLWAASGDLVVGTENDTASILTKGTSGQILQAGASTVAWTDAMTTTLTSEAQGDILYRNASGWVNLPPGTAGRVLSTGGAGADPSWVAASGTGTVTSVTPGAGITGSSNPITTTGTLSISAGAITRAMQVNGAALSVVGNGTGSTAVETDLAGTASQVLRVNNAGTTLGFGQVDLSQSPAVTGTLQSANGGTSNQFFTVSGPATTTKTFTFPNANSTVLTSNAPVTVAQGGTGLATLTSGSVLVGAGASNVSLVAPGTNGNLLTSNGTAWVSSAAPGGSGTVTATGGALTSNAVVLGAGTTDTKVAAGLTTDGVSALILGVAGTAAVGDIDFKNGTSGTISLKPVTGALGTVTVSLPATTGTVYVSSGTDVAVADGGTGLSSGTSGGILGYTATGTLASTAALGAGNIIVGGGAGVVPTSVTAGAITDILVGGGAGTAPVWTAATGSGSPVRGTSPALTTPTGIVKGDVGLGNVDNTSNATERAASATLTNKLLSDSTSAFADNGDTTKRLAVELSGITASTTRTMTPPNEDFTIMGLATAQSPTNKTLDTTAASGNVIKFKDVSFIPIEWCIDGTTPPTAAATLTSTNKVRVRDFSDTANQDVQCPWMVPADIGPTTTVTYRVISFVDVTTAPANTEVVAFSLAGATVANSELLSATLGSAVTSSVTVDGGAAPTGTFAQYDRIATSYSGAVTLTGMAAGETALLSLTRLATTTDTYGQLLGVVGIEIKYMRQVNND